MHLVPVVLLIVVVAGLVFGPTVWVQRVFRKYHEPRELYAGTGADLARELLKSQRLENIAVEQTEPGQDHYDPRARAVRLSPDNYNGRSLTAITVAAHEVGHAMQHASDYPLFRLRQGLVQVARYTEKLGSAVIMAMPVLAIATRSPAVGGMIFLLGVSGIAFGTLVHLVTLPVEWNASFGRALPLLRTGQYIAESHQPHAARILKAAALTYVAGSLASLLNLYRWIAILRR